MSQVCAKCWWGAGKRPQHIPRELGGIQAQQQQQEWPFLPHSTWKRQDTRVKEQSVKFPRDYKMPNYTKIEEKIDRFLMCIKKQTNKRNKNPQSPPKCNTEFLGRADPNWSITTSIPARDRQIPQGLFFFFPKYLGRIILIFSCWFQVGKPFCIRSLSDQPQMWAPRVRQCWTDPALFPCGFYFFLFFWGKSGSAGSEIQSLLQWSFKGWTTALEILIFFGLTGQNLPIIQQISD